MAAKTTTHRPTTAKPRTPVKAAKQSASAGAEDRAQRRVERQSLQRAARRPRADAADRDDAGGRLFVSALARGLEVLGAFRAGDRALGNQELAERTGLPKPTISRMTHTLIQLGYLTYEPRSATYQLGARALALSYAALANLDVRKAALPIMTRLAEDSQLHVGLGTRERLMMLNIESCESDALIGLRLPPGSRVPIATTSLGRAYLAAIGEDERTPLLAELRAHHGNDWPKLEKAIARSAREMAKSGFCISIGEWRKDINAVGAAIVPPNGGPVYTLSFGGPAYLVSQQQLIEKHGPALARAAKAISFALGG
ncbi:IclR family transcriptional regulator [Rhodopseudomonas thermotolerans]|uniref:IclR family transcriptional regulator n=2 Tax=Rhodopseudomonas TaxID=1073 RepID=A0A336JY44_9BRAD|nr:IclR family transcriptional regulator [Rhodopseudomonas pentothenatexigens]REG03054.1 IclR family transcriptional regulator [Rhodopseudomonas thermotolerans]SSW90901.1 IclR family transcriptional regulator [Rhodopseudomonas pentothenatexigens]